MKLALTIEYDVDADNPQVEALLDEVIAEEARGFVELVRRRLADEGVRDIEMTVRETGA